MQPKCPICIGNPPQKMGYLSDGSRVHTCMGCGYVVRRVKKEELSDDSPEQPNVV